MPGGAFASQQLVVSPLVDNDFGHFRPSWRRKRLARHDLKLVDRVFTPLSTCVSENRVFSHSAKPRWLTPGAKSGVSVNHVFIYLVMCISWTPQSHEPEAPTRLQSEARNHVPGPASSFLPFHQIANDPPPSPRLQSHSKALSSNRSLYPSIHACQATYHIL